jgi:hypothetical protein
MRRHFIQRAQDGIVCAYVVCDVEVNAEKAKYAYMHVTSPACRKMPQYGDCQYSFRKPDKVQGRGGGEITHKSQEGTKDPWLS